MSVCGACLVNIIANLPCKRHNDTSTIPLLQGAIIVSLKNAFKEFRRVRVKNKKKAERTTPTRVSRTIKLRSPGENVLFHHPKVPSGWKNIICVLL